ncbi:MAG: hypothetical protein RSC65_03845 [Malacoplasma sp.]
MNIQEIILDQIIVCNDKALDMYDYHVGIILPSRDALEKIKYSNCLTALLSITNVVKPYHYTKDGFFILTPNGNQITISSMDRMNEIRSGMFNKMFVSNSIDKTDIDHLRCFIHRLYRKDFNNSENDYPLTPIEILPIEI